MWFHSCATHLSAARLSFHCRILKKILYVFVIVIRKPNTEAPMALHLVSSQFDEAAMFVIKSYRAVTPGCYTREDSIFACKAAAKQFSERNDFHVLWTPAFCQFAQSLIVCKKDLLVSQISKVFVQIAKQSTHPQTVRDAATTNLKKWRALFKEQHQVH